MSGKTRIKSRPSIFIQPNLEAVASVTIDPAIDWFRSGASVFIPEGGVYEIVSINVFTMVIKLKTAVAPPGTQVIASVMYPQNNDTAATTWGGANGKEW